MKTARNILVIMNVALICYCFHNCFIGYKQKTCTHNNQQICNKEKTKHVTDC